MTSMKDWPVRTLNVDNSTLGSEIKRAAGHHAGSIHDIHLSGAVAVVTFCSFVTEAQVDRALAEILANGNGRFSKLDGPAGA